MELFLTETKPRDGEIKCYTIAIGNAPLVSCSDEIRQKMFHVWDMISSFDGFIGFHPHLPLGTLCLFRTLNDAKVAGNLMDAEGIAHGTYICDCFIKERFFPPSSDSKKECYDGAPIQNA